MARRARKRILFDTTPRFRLVVFPILQPDGSWINEQRQSWEWLLLFVNADRSKAWRPLPEIVPADMLPISESEAEALGAYRLYLSEQLDQWAFLQAAAGKDDGPRISPSVRFGPGVSQAYLSAKVKRLAADLDQALVELCGALGHVFLIKCRNCGAFDLAKRQDKEHCLNASCRASAHQRTRTADAKSEHAREMRRTRAQVKVSTLKDQRARLESALSTATPAAKPEIEYRIRNLERRINRASCDITNQSPKTQ